MNRIEYLKKFKGGDNEDTPINNISIIHMQYIVDKCKELDLKEPEIYPWAGGDGVQAEWDTKYTYIEIDSSSNGISALFVNNNKDSRDYKDSISCKFDDIKDAFLMAKHFLYTDQLKENTEEIRKSIIGIIKPED